MIVVTAATGKLGAHVVSSLLEKVPAAEVAVAVRNPDKAKSYAARGVEVRQADYAKPDTLRSAFRKGERMLLVSSSAMGQRAAQHVQVVDAAKAAGVGLLAYTSILHGDQSRLKLAAEHVATEAMIRASGLPFVLLRNGWYLENYAEHLEPALATGALYGSARDGRIAAAARADYAAAAARVLTESGHANQTYELAGDEPFTMSQLAAEIAKQSGKPVAYHDLPFEEYRAALVRAGLPADYADALADSDVGIARGELDDRSGTLRRLIGRPTTTLAGAIAAALRERGV
jgi:NAD(P)H dehydrogenase (quinone)